MLITQTNLFKRKLHVTYVRSHQKSYYIPLYFEYHNHKFEIVSTGNFNIIPGLHPWSTHIEILLVFLQLLHFIFHFIEFCIFKREDLAPK